MKILILGAGGREHALGWKIAQSERAERIYFAPGNAGTRSLGENVDIDAGNFDQVGEFVLQTGVDMVVVGPEAPLVNGIVNHFRNHSTLRDVLIVGPDKSAAALEGSKDFAKDFMRKYDIPTASSRSFSSYQLDEAIAHLDEMEPPYVLKADGLAAGKGVLIVFDKEDAAEHLRGMLVGDKFGKAGNTVVMEEFLDGIEFSVFVLTDGQNYILLPEAKDYKRIGEGDTGLNTGGMGSVSPVPFFDGELKKKTVEKIIEPTIKGMVKEGMDYRGFLFFGLMKVEDEPCVIEYNVRMGDPECQAVVPRIKSDLVDLLEATARKELENSEIVTDERTVSAVVVVSGGYPGKYEKGKEVKGLEDVDESIVFHAGTGREGKKIVTSGGRVMAFSSYGNDLETALQRSYASIGKVYYSGIYFRRDIGQDLLYDSH